MKIKTKKYYERECQRLMLDIKKIETEGKCEISGASGESFCLQPHHWNVSRKYKRVKYNLLNILYITAQLHRLAHDKPLEFLKIVEAKKGAKWIMDVTEHISKELQKGKMTISDWEQQYNNLNEYYLELIKHNG